MADDDALAFPAVKRARLRGGNELVVFDKKRLAAGAQVGVIGPGGIAIVSAAVETVDSEGPTHELEHIVVDDAARCVDLHGAGPRGANAEMIDPPRRGIASQCQHPFVVAVFRAAAAVDREIAEPGQPALLRIDFENVKRRSGGEGADDDGRLVGPYALDRNALARDLDAGRPGGGPRGELHGVAVGGRIDRGLDIRQREAGRGVGCGLQGRTQRQQAAGKAR